MSSCTRRVIGQSGEGTDHPGPPGRGCRARGGPSLAHSEQQWTRCAVAAPAARLLIGAGGDHPLSYYETLGGGEGGTPGRPGMSGVHTGMTNTQNTPAEAVELDYPLRVWRYELRTSSGGDGAHPGGDGLIREIEVLADCTLTVQSERRQTRPWGLGGGHAGAAGRNLLRRADGTETELPSKGTWQLHCGQRIRIETPGGGGWGSRPATPTSRLR